MDPHPALAVDLTDLSLPPNGSSAFTATVDGPSVGFVWFHNNLLIPGATNAALAITSASPGAQGTYHVIATNFAGGVTSRVAMLSFNSSALAILDGPHSTNVVEGSKVVFSVAAPGVAPISFQWFLESTPLLNATNVLLSIASVDRTNAGNYHVVVTNVYLSLTSASALLTVITRPVLSIAVGGTNLLITCSGSTGQVHRLLCATNLTSTDLGTPVATNTIPASGEIVWPRPLPTNGPAFYRAVSP